MIPSFRASLVDWVEQLHAAVDRVAAPVAAANVERLQCREGCSDCCTDGLTVFELEAAVIARHHATLLAEGTPSEAGCAFLDEAGACRIYAQRPYVCRTQGLPLRWLEEEEETGDILETRDICPKNLDGPPLEELDADTCWTLGPFEQRLADRQAEAGEEGARVALRSLFANVGGKERRHLPVTR